MVTARARLLSTDTQLQRSSHTLSVVNKNAYIFGGELVPREPRDNHIIQVGVATDNFEKVRILSDATVTAPSARVGTASAVINDRIYFFSGRGGVAMAPIDENGCLHVFDTLSASWSQVTPRDQSAAVPSPRSYHCMTSDGQNMIFVHAGCPEAGRLSDLWAYNLLENRWSELSDAPPPQRGGPSIVHHAGRLYRMNGFDGKTEQGGQVDIYDISTGKWTSVKFKADGHAGPEPRSVSALVHLVVGGRDKLLTLYGEHDPSALGHAGAGKMLANLWLWDIREQTWELVGTADHEVPSPRGWFAAASVSAGDVVAVGGLNESNERLADAWLLSLEE